MGELKVKADRSPRDTQYDANQLYNYLSLAMKCYAQDDANLPNSFSHVILLPNVDFRWFVKGEQWIKQLQVGVDRHMQFDIQETDRFAKKKKKNQMYIKKSKELDECLVKIPIYCRSYYDLVNSFEKVIAGYPLESHWRRISRELRELAKIASDGL